VTTALQARSAIYALVYAALQANATTAPIAAGTGGALLWDNVKGTKPGEGTNSNPYPWIRLAMRHTVGGQDTLGAVGRRRYLSGGIFTAQIFTAAGDGNTAGYTIAEVIKAALRGASPHSTVWFTGEMGITEVGEDGPWFNVNVDAEFRYQERA